MDPDTISKMRYEKIRPVCLTISSKDKIRRPEKVSEKDLQKTAMIIGRDLRTDIGQGPVGEPVQTETTVRWKIWEYRTEWYVDP